MDVPSWVPDQPRIAQSRTGCGIYTRARLRRCRSRPLAFRAGGKFAVFDRHVFLSLSFASSSSTTRVIQLIAFGFQEIADQTGSFAVLPARRILWFSPLFCSLALASPALGIVLGSLAPFADDVDFFPFQRHSFIARWSSTDSPFPLPLSLPPGPSRSVPRGASSFTSIFLHPLPAFSPATMLVAAVAFSLLSLSTGALPLSSPPSTGHQLAAIEIDSWKDLSSIPFSSSTTRQRRRRDVKLDLGDGNVVVLDAVEGQDDGSLTEDSSFNDDDDDGASEEQVFEPSDVTKVVRNPKVIPNPKSPNFMSTSSSSPAATSTSTTTSSSPTASAAVTTYKGEATYFFQGGVAGACGNVNPDSALIVALDYRLVSAQTPRSWVSPSIGRFLFLFSFGLSCEPSLKLILLLLYLSPSLSRYSLTPRDSTAIWVKCQNIAAKA